MILVSGVGLTGLALLIDHISDQISLCDQLSAIAHWKTALAFVVIVPLVIYLEHLLLRDLPLFRELEAFSRSIFETMKPSGLQIFAISLSAGVSEELLFRGVIQPIAGIWWTSLLFAGVHTGFRLRPRVVRHYMIMVFILSVLLGLISRHSGLPAAIVSHIMWDLVSLWMIIKLSGDSAAGMNPLGCDDNEADSCNQEKHHVINN